ncbi:MAG TPA: transglutaminase domain-containing protein [Candidatus Methylomirabilis sp.]|nr:transglutaminase domain-containing protein [Candidatus Methylomirabilis sp.]
MAATGSQDKKHVFFRVAWRSVNALLAAALVSSIYAGVREYSVRRYLQGFADAVVPGTATPEQKIEAILAWMRVGPARNVATNPAALAARDPETTLNYQQLLNVCGTATNAFLNLARSGGLNVRRLLLLTPEYRVKHVVAEVEVSRRWVIVDPAFRVMFRSTKGQLLTRSELQDPIIFDDAISSAPLYPREYDYERFTHVRLERLPIAGAGIRRVLDIVFPNWDEVLDWSLLLERESSFVLVVSVCVALFFFLLRVVLAWYADHRLRIARYHFRQHALRAGVAFFSTPEIEQ